LELHRQITESFLINDIEAFGEKIAALGTDFHLPRLFGWGRRLCEQADMFDIDAVHESLAEFPELVSELRETACQPPETGADQC
jgi:extradiol dioxygenase family protein